MQRYWEHLDEQSEPRASALADPRGRVEAAPRGGRLPPVCNCSRAVPRGTTPRRPQGGDATGCGSLADGDPLELHVTGNAANLSETAVAAYRRLNWPERVRFLGSIDDRELARQYASARLLLMLSRDEGFGLPVLEAMAYGCPVIAAARGSLPEVLGDAGILVNPEDADEVADAIRTLLNSPDRRAVLVDRARRRARAFAWEKAASRMVEVYHEALS
jgi:glycosyltransferase involved in cell wall biosynthesis